MCFGGGPQVDTSASQNAAQQQAADEAARQGRVSAGMGKINDMFGTYNQDYYNNLGNQYQSYYQPQLDKQYSDAKQQQAFNLANQGLSNSSFAGKASADLARANQQSQQQILGNSNNYMNQAKGSVENVRNDLISQLNASADPSQINQTALNRITVQPVNSLAPLSNAFGDIAGVAANGVNAYQGISGQPLAQSLFGQNNNSPYGQMGSTTGSGSSKVVK